MTQKFQPPRGTRDFMPEDMARRQYVFEKLRNVFESFGFRPLETPAFESWELLGAKGGGGEAIKNEVYVFKDKGGREMGLRFDLTVPAARVVASNPQLPRPFKRCQIGPVWRYDNPQAGRFREFWQADIDTFGVAGMEADAEIIAATVEALKALGFKDFRIRLNNRKILNGIMKCAGVGDDKCASVFRALDKLEKVGEKEVAEELVKSGLNDAIASKLLSLVKVGGKPDEVLASSAKKLRNVSIAEEGIKEIEELIVLLKSYGVSKFIEIDFSLVRGLDYYTGPIFEVSGGEGIEGGPTALRRRVSDGQAMTGTVMSPAVGSLAGGGRYDRLIGMLSGREEPAVGISFGVERICELMGKKGLFKDIPATKTRVFIAATGDEPKLKKAAIETAKKLRGSGIAVETNLMGRKLKQCFDYADKMGIPCMIIIGEKELASGKLTLRDMKKRKQATLSINSAIKALSCN